MRGGLGAWAVRENVDARRRKNQELSDEALPVEEGTLVSPDGTVLMDQLGRVSVAGITRVELELMLQERSSGIEGPVIRVTVIPASPGEPQ